MKLLHTVKSGKVNEIELSKVRYATRHLVKNVEGVKHEGWVIKAHHEDKEHEYMLVFSPEEANEFWEWIGKMRSRFESNSLDFIQEESHDE